MLRMNVQNWPTDFKIRLPVRDDIELKEKFDLPGQEVRIIWHAHAGAKTTDLVRTSQMF